MSKIKVFWKKQAIPLQSFCRGTIAGILIYLSIIFKIIPENGLKLIFFFFGVFFIVEMVLIYLWKKLEKD